MTRRQHSIQDELDSRWHLDKRVPITLIVFFLLQICSFVWYAATANERLNVIEKAIEKRESLGERMAIVELKVTSIETSTQRIRDYIGVLVARERPDLNATPHELTPAPTPPAPKKPRTKTTSAKLP